MTEHLVPAGPFGRQIGEAGDSHPTGRRPSMAALTTSGARKASEIVEERFPKPLQNRDPEHLQRSPGGPP
jgi:hypothetical protein